MCSGALRCPPWGWQRRSRRSTADTLRPMLPEDEMVERIRVVAGRGDGVLVGIGDDAAVLEDGLVVSSDMLVDGVHFRSTGLGAHEIGARAAAVNLSDLAAMGATPVCLITSLGLPEGFDAVDDLTAGL